MRAKKFLIVFIIILMAVSAFAAGKKYIVILKQDQVLLDTESVGPDVIRNSVKNNGKSVIAAIKKFNTSLIESNGDMNDASEPPVKYQELWLTNSIAVEGDSKIVEVLKNDSKVLDVIPDFEIMLDDYSEEGAGEAGFDEYAEDEKILNWGVRYIKAPDAWEQFGTKGRGALIGVLDTGVNVMHKIFRDESARCKIVMYKDFASNAALPGDKYGHGSHVAGIICGGKFNKQYIGVAPDSRVIFGKVFGVNGKSFFSVIINALQWMSDPDGNPNTKDYPCAVNCSFRVPIPYGMNENSVLTEFNKIAKNMLSLGIIPVKSAGNGGSDTINTITMPGYSPYFFTVGAIDSEGNRASFSSIGKPGKSKPEVMAPGRRVYSAKYSDNGVLITKSGTSMAAPAVCGLIALIKSANPRLSARDIIKIIVRTTNDIEDTGFDYKTGHGIVDAFRAVRSAKRTKGNEARLNNQLYNTITGKPNTSGNSPWVNVNNDNQSNNSWINVNKKSDNSWVDLNSKSTYRNTNNSDDGWVNVGAYNADFYDADEKKGEIQRNEAKLNELIKKNNLKFDK